MTILTGTEILYVVGKTPIGGLSSLPEPCTTQQIAALSGSAGYFGQSIVTTGTTKTITIGSFVGFNSPTSGNKTLNIPTSNGSLALVTVSDIYGTAATYPITVVPATGSISGLNQVYTNYGAITLLDTTAGWVSI